MARDCSVCGHRDHRAIDAALVAGRSPRAVAAEFGLNHQAVERHRRNHLPIVIRRQAREALERAENATGEAQDVRDASDLPEPAQTAQALPGPSLAAPEAVAEEGPPPASPVRGRRRGLALGDETLPVATVAPAPAQPSATSSPANAPGVFNSYEEAVALRSRALAILAQAERDADLKTTLMAIREARGVLDHLARLEERQGSAGQAAPLVQSEEWARTRTAILTALADYPEARLAVAEALVSTGAMS